MENAKKVQVAMYVEPEVAERLRAAADREARTVASWLRFHVLRQLESTEPEAA
jgi:predicted DNA-binding protein